MDGARYLAGSGPFSARPFGSERNGLSGGFSFPPDDDEEFRGGRGKRVNRPSATKTTILSAKLRYSAISYCSWLRPKQPRGCMPFHERSSPNERLWNGSLMSPASGPIEQMANSEAECPAITSAICRLYGQSRRRGAVDAIDQMLAPRRRRHDRRCRRCAECRATHLEQRCSSDACSGLGVRSRAPTTTTCLHGPRRVG
jgi:hypothetical protein